MAMNGFGWDMEAGAASPPSSEEMAEATLPYYAHCLDAFGPSRCMFESVRDHQPPCSACSARSPDTRALHIRSPCKVLTPLVLGWHLQNFPVDKVSSSYHTLWNSFKRVAAAHGLSESEKRQAFGETAQRVYSLDIQRPAAASL